MKQRAKLMIPSGISFQDVEIEPDIGECVVQAINHLISERPNASIDIQKVAEAVGFPGTTVKPVFYMLLGLRLLKATFIPRHRTCGRMIAEQEQSAEVILEKARNEEYWCIHCAEPIEGPQDIETQIIFWKPGANVKQ